MMEVHIYIGTDSKAPRVQPRKYGYVTTKGKPVANGDLWKQLKEKAGEHLLLSEPGKHEYSMWIQEQLKRVTTNC